MAAITSTVLSSIEKHCPKKARMTPVLNITPTTEEEVAEFYLEMIEAMD